MFRLNQWPPNSMRIVIHLWHTPSWRKQIEGSSLQCFHTNIHIVSTWSWLPELLPLRLSQFCFDLIWFLNSFCQGQRLRSQTCWRRFGVEHTVCTHICIYIYIIYIWLIWHIIHHKWQLPPSFREPRALWAMGRLMSITLTASSWRRLGNRQTCLTSIAFWSCSSIAMLCIFIPDRWASLEFLDEGGACNMLS